MTNKLTYSILIKYYLNIKMNSKHIYFFNFINRMHIAFVRLKNKGGFPISKSSHFYY